MNRVSQNEDDKRDFIRMKIDTPAEVIILSKGKRLKGICRDLSGGGMSIETRVGLHIGTEMEIKLTSNYGDSPMLRARAQVARVQRSQSGKFTLGLEILEMLD